MNCRRHYNDEDIDLYRSLQLTNKENDFCLGYTYIDPKT